MMDQAERLRVLARFSDSRVPVAARPRVIAVTSGKGGVGKSNIAANLGVLLARRGISTAILDADLGLSSVQFLMDCVAQHNLGDVIRDGKSIPDVWTEGPAGVKVISTGSGLDGLANLPSANRQNVISMLLSPALGVDALIADIAPGISDDVIDFLRVADEVLVVTTPEPTAVMDSYALIKIVFASGLDCRLELIVNAASDKQTAELTALNIDSMCLKFLNRSIDAWDWIPYDANLRSAATRRQPIVDLYPESQMSKRLRMASMEVASRIYSRGKAAR